MPKIAALLFTLYLGLSPVTWWPGVSPGVMNGFKFSLISLAVILAWASAGMSGGVKVPRGWLGPGGLLLVLITASAAIAQAPVLVSIQRIKAFLLSFVMLWTFFMYRRLGRDAERIFFGASLIVAAHCALVAASGVFGFPDWPGPAEYLSAPHLWISGFAGLRTGWSNGVALFTPVLAARVLAVEHNSRVRFLSALALAAIVASQVVVAGRAGLLASLVGVGIVASQRRHRKWLLLYLGTLALVATLMTGYLYSHMRLEYLSHGGGLIARLNKASSGRLDVDLRALQLAAKRPFTGYGFGTINFSGHQIHNLWLRLLVDGGVALPLGFTLIVLTIFRRMAAVRGAYRRALRRAGNGGRRLLQQTEDRYFLYRAVLFAGLLIALFEPEYLLGAFQNSALWWAIAGAALVPVAASTPIPSRRRHPERTGSRLAPERAGVPIDASSGTSKRGSGAGGLGVTTLPHRPIQAIGVRAKPQSGDSGPR